MQVEASLLVLKLPPGVQIAGQPRASGAGLTGAVQSTEALETAPPGAVGQVAGEAAAPAGVHHSNVRTLPGQRGLQACWWRRPAEQPVHILCADRGQSNPGREEPVCSASQQSP